MGAERVSHVRRPLQGATLLGRLTGVEAVVFDVGETLVDETSAWEAWADHLGIPRFTFMATFGAVVARGEDHRRVFELLAPHVEAKGDPPGWQRSVEDLYTDAAPAILAIAGMGLRVGVAGNQLAATEAFFAELDLPIDLVASSEGWGVSKPDTRFFTRIAEELDLAPPGIVYVGDRLDNDVAPAAAVGMRAVLVRRGPWGIRDASQARAQAKGAVAVVDSLAELVGLIREG